MSHQLFALIHTIYDPLIWCAEQIYQISALHTESAGLDDLISDFTYQYCEFMIHQLLSLKTKKRVIIIKKCVMRLFSSAFMVHFQATLPMCWLYAIWRICFCDRVTDQLQWSMLVGASMESSDFQGHSDGPLKSSDGAETPMQHTIRIDSHCLTPQWWPDTRAADRFVWVAPFNIIDEESINILYNSYLICTY